MAPRSRCHSCFPAVQTPAGRAGCLGPYLTPSVPQRCAPSGCGSLLPRHAAGRAHHGESSRCLRGAGPRTGTAGTGPPAEAAAHPERGAGSGSVPPQGASPAPGRSEPRHPPRHPSAPCGRRSHLGGAGPGRAASRSRQRESPRSARRPPPRPPHPRSPQTEPAVAAPRFPLSPAQPAALSRPGPAPTAGIHAAAAMARPAPRPSRPRRHGHSARNREEPGTGTGTSPAPPRPGQPGPGSAVRMRCVSRPALAVVALRWRRWGGGDVVGDPQPPVRP